MQYNNIYMFNILYEGKNGRDTFCKIYSDDESVFALKNLPDTTYKIERSHLMKDLEGNSSFYNSMPDEFWVGEKLTPQDLKNEIKMATDEKLRDELQDWYENITKSVWGHSVEIIKLNNGRLIYVANASPVRVIGVIRNGQVVNKPQALQSEQTSKCDKTSKKGYGNDNYIDLE